MHKRGISTAITMALCVSFIPSLVWAQSTQAVGSSNAHIQSVTQVSTQVQPAAPAIPGAPVPTTTTTTVPAAPGSVLAPAASPSASQAVTTLQQNVQGTPSPSSSGSFDVSQADESTLIREMSKAQARLAFLKMMGQIEDARLEIERNKMKFEQEKLEAKEKSSSPSANTVPGLPLPSGGPMPSGPLPVNGGGPASAVDFMMDSSKPSVRSIYSFDGKYFAEIITTGGKTIARSGTSLPNGDKVLSISAAGVSLLHKGKKMVLGVEAAPAVSKSPSP